MLPCMFSPVIKLSKTKETLRKSLQRDFPYENILTVGLIHFMPPVFSKPPENSKKQRFSDVFRGKERDQWLDMG